MKYKFTSYASLQGKSDSRIFADIYTNRFVDQTITIKNRCVYERIGADNIVHDDQAAF